MTFGKQYKLIQCGHKWYFQQKKATLHWNLYQFNTCKQWKYSRFVYETQNFNLCILLVTGYLTFTFWRIWTILNIKLETKIWKFWAQTVSRLLLWSWIVNKKINQVYLKVSYLYDFLRQKLFFRNKSKYFRFKRTKCNIMYLIPLN